MSADTDICAQCGRPRAEHSIDQYSGRQVKCPVIRETVTTPPQEHERSPRGDY